MQRHRILNGTYDETDWCYPFEGCSEAQLENELETELISKRRGSDISQYLFPILADEISAVNSICIICRVEYGTPS
jgi:hypothetical protein